MGRFGKGDGPGKVLEDKIVDLGSEINKLTRQLQDKEDQVAYSDQVLALKQELVDLTIDRDRKVSDFELSITKRTEEFEREKREVEHMVGLLDKQGKFERESAAREAVLKVREENLTAERTLFEDKMGFVEKSLSTQISYLKDDILKAVLGVLDVSVHKEISEGTPRRRKTTSIQ